MFCGPNKKQSRIRPGNCSEAVTLWFNQTNHIAPRVDVIKYKSKPSNHNPRTTTAKNAIKNNFVVGDARYLLSVHTKHHILHRTEILLMSVVSIHSTHTHISVCLLSMQSVVISVIVVHVCEYGKHVFEQVLLVLKIFSNQFFVLLP